MNTEAKTPSVDVFEFEISADRGLEEALEVAVSQKKNISLWKEDKGVLKFGYGGSDSSKNWIPFLGTPTTQELSRLIIDWLKKQEYGNEPDLDGSCNKGWQVTSHKDIYSNDWQHVFSVKPCWIKYHK